MKYGSVSWPLSHVSKQHNIFMLSVHFCKGCPLLRHDSAAALKYRVEESCFYIIMSVYSETLPPTADVHLYLV